MNCATKHTRTQILVCFIWAVACVVFLFLPLQGTPPAVTDPMLFSEAAFWALPETSFPGGLRYRVRKWAWRRYCALRQAHQRALWVAQCARLALCGALSMAQVVDVLTQAQYRQHLGSLPVLYALLETLQVRTIINRYCPTRAQVDHGTVALVLVLNRLSMPLPLYQVADWMAQTVLTRILALPAAKFNDDRLGRTLDALAPHCAAIWQEVVQRALVQAEVDLSLVFYDLTAFISHGKHVGSQYLDFGFANNTPSNKRKLKLGLEVSADGHLPIDYTLWSGRTTDMATVDTNMARLKHLLQRHGWTEQVTVVGDRANLSDELALAYDERGLRYVSALRLLKTEHKALLAQPLPAHFRAGPLSQGRGRYGYWGVPCTVPFAHQGRQVTHRGLVVLSGPMRSSLRQTRAARLRALHQELRTVQSKIGQPRYRSVRAVQWRAQVKLNASSVGQLVHAEAYTDEQGQVCLRWWTDRYALWQESQRDGRYLLVSNDWRLTAREMFDLYHRKDGVEKRIAVSKQELHVAPLYLHQDNRIQALLLLNMLALLAYSLLERQVNQRGVHMTTRRILAKLQSLEILVTRCWDGSQLYRLAPVDAQQAQLLQVLADVLAHLRWPRCAHPLWVSEEDRFIALPPPGQAQRAV